MMPSKNISLDGWKQTLKSRCFTVTSPNETMQIAQELGDSLSLGDVVLLEGDLGAGKTTFVKGLAQSLTIEPDLVVSPTFNYLNIYGSLAHFDLYRLEHLDQFLSMGFDEYLSNEFITCIEWPSLIESIAEPNWIVVSLQHQKDGREIEIRGMGN